MKSFSVYNYENPRELLLAFLAQKQKKNPKYSVRSWAKKMELTTHTLLVMLLQGKREIRPKHEDFLSKGLNLKDDEKRYLKTLILYHNAKTMEEKKHIKGFLRDLNPGNDFQTTELDQFEVIAHWIHMAILAMSQLKDFVLDDQQIYRKLKGKASLSEIRMALVRLKKLNLLKMDQTGKLVPTFNRVTSRNDVADEGAREYHRQVMKLADKALDEVDLEQREFQAFTMSIAKDKIPLAKEMIRQFRAKLSKAVSGNGDEVYQTNIQFFKL